MRVLVAAVPAHRNLALDVATISRCLEVDLILRRSDRGAVRRSGRTGRQADPGLSSVGPNRSVLDGDEELPGRVVLDPDAGQVLPPRRSGRTIGRAVTRF